MTDAVMQGYPAPKIVPLFASITKDGRLPKQDADEVLLSAAEKAAFALARESPVDGEAADRVSDLYKAVNPNFKAEGRGLLDYPGYISVAFSNTLFEVLHGQTPYWDPNNSISFQIGREESPIVQRNAILAEYRTVSSGGGYQSVGLPIGGGMYYRIGGSIPRSQHTGLVSIEEGKMLITTRAIYFGGLQHNFRLPYASILRLEPFADAVGVFPEYGSGRVFIPGSLGFDDGWFFYNLILALTARTAST